MLISEVMAIKQNSPIAKCVIPPYKSWLRRLRNPEITQAIAIVPGCPPELDDDNLLLKIAHNLVTRPGGLKLELNWKLPPCWLAYTVPKVL